MTRSRFGLAPALDRSRLVLVGAALLLSSAGYSHGETLPRHALNLLLPGHSSVSLDSLDPDFRARVQKVVLGLHKRGYSPRVVSSYRSPMRQDVIFTASTVSRFVGRGTYTQVSGGQSCHNHEVDGDAAALAIDITDPHADTMRAKATFYKALGAEAKKAGLAWGGNWKRSNRAWRRYGLGWDPGHIESRRCRRALRKARRQARGH